jgi:hypothetical protein
MRSVAMRLIIEIPDELAPGAAPAVQAAADAVSGGAAPDGVAPESQAGAPAAGQALPAGEAEFGGVAAASMPASAPAMDGGAAPEGVRPREA